MGMNQKESVYAATVAIASEKGVDFSKATDLPKEVRSAIVDVVTQSIIDGDTEFSAEAHEKHTTPDAVRKYVVGLVNNWFRKDVRLNGGTKYEAKNPGSRQGLGDPQIKELNKLLTLHPEAKADIQVAIDARKAEIGTAKKEIVIDMSKIPEHLKSLLVKPTTEEVESTTAEA